MTVSKIINNLAKMSSKVLVLGFVVILGGCSIFGGGDKSAAKVEAAEEVFQIGVNAYLWRATLDTLSFMPLKSVDHNGGVILTDWKNNPGNSNDRSKVDVIILGRKLTADSIQITVHRQILVDGQWRDEAPLAGASVNIQNAILIQARLLRQNNAPIK